MGQPCPLDLHPDVAALARDCGITRPRTLARLQALHDRWRAAADAAEDAPGWDATVLTYLTRHGSRPVDPEAERVARRMTRPDRRAA